MHASGPVHRLAIRADASRAIGVGHLGRCAAIAQAVRDTTGHQPHFLCCDKDGLTAAFLRERGLAAPIELAEGGEGHDARQTLDIVGAHGIERILVDHYGLGVDWLRLLTEHIEVAVLDDLGRRDLVDHAAAFIDPSLPADPEANRSDDLVFRGPRFAPMPALFATRHPDEPRRGRVRRIVITFGGTDPRDMTPLVIAALRRSVPDAAEVDVVIGPGFAAPDPVEAAARAAGFVPHRSPRDLVALLAKADLAVIGAGTTAFECACLGVPAVAVRVADNQHSGCAALAARGTLVDAGDWSTCDEKTLAGSVADLVGDEEARHGMSRSGLRLVDGLGAARCAGILLGLRSEDGREPDPLFLRPAAPPDRGMLRSWRNDPQTRAMSRQRSEVGAAEHAAWLDRTLRDPSHDLLVGEDRRGPVGQVRFDHAGEHACEVSVTVAPARRGEGLSPKLVDAGLRWLRAKRRTCEVLARIRHENLASQRCFERCGFARGEDDDPTRGSMQQWHLSLEPSPSGCGPRDETWA